MIREPETQATFDDSFSLVGFRDPDEVTAKASRLLEECRQTAAEHAAKLFLKHGYFNGHAEASVTQQKDHVDVSVMLTCYGLPLNADVAAIKTEIASVLILMDGLAETWGDEGVFRRCRDRLRKLVTV